MTNTDKKVEAVMNELARKGREWSADLQYAVEWQVSIADGKDTAREIAKRITTETNK